jgi:hypothetical protein
MEARAYFLIEFKYLSSLPVILFVDDDDGAEDHSLPEHEDHLLDDDLVGRFTVWEFSLTALYIIGHANLDSVLLQEVDMESLKREEMYSLPNTKTSPPV